MLLFLLSILPCDSVRLQELRSDRDYAYNSDLLNDAPNLATENHINPEQSLFYQLIHWLANDGKVVSFIILAVVLLLITYFALRSIRHTPANPDDREEPEQDENIYEIDLDSALSDALARNDYSQAVRFTYLKTLRLLADADSISWQIGKTPVQYTREYVQPEFLTMTNVFLRVRYGKYNASADNYHHCHRLAETIEEQLRQQDGEAGEGGGQ